MVLACVLAWRFTEFEFLRFASMVAMGGVMVFTARNFGIREWYLAGLSALLTLTLVATTETFFATILKALDQAAFLMAFIFLLALLHQAAATSKAIAEFGAYLTQQNPGRRFVSLFWGSNVMAVLFNLGAVNLLTPLVQRGLAARGLSDALREISERRQISAILRGFAWNAVWTPTAIAPLALLELIEGIDRQRWTMLGLVLATVMFLAGWAEDRWTARRLLDGRSAPGQSPKFPAAAFLGFMGVVVSLFGIIWVVVVVTGDTLVAGLMLACPVIMVLWLLVQVRGAPVAAFQRSRDILTVRLPDIALVAATLAFSGYLGRVAAELTPAAALVDALNLYDVPDLAILGALPLLIAALSFLGVSPIMLAVFFGSLFGSLPVLPVDATLLALSISSGWSLAMLLSPYATVVMILAQQIGQRGLQVAMGWNGVFAIACAVLLVLCYAVMLGL